ncbi:MAG: LPP20 family lipoprotein, partial [Bacteroidales bacterium]|nr:LPP20 family lipoprotein [Bacteroidales bacterium]
MRAFLLFVVFFLNFTVLFSQSIESIKADRRTYLWGEATANSLKKADNLALDMLISQISTEVEAKFTLIKDENILDDDYSYSETVKSVVNTYSNASLTNTERIVISNEPDAKVFRYIKR